MWCGFYNLNRHKMCDKLLQSVGGKKRKNIILRCYIIQEMV